MTELGEHTSRAHSPLTTLLSLERTIQQRRAEQANVRGASIPFHLRFGVLRPRDDGSCRTGAELGGSSCSLLRQPVLQCPAPGRLLEFLEFLKFQGEAGGLRHVFKATNSGWDDIV